MIKPITKAIIPVAGLGTRMLPATKAIPKELLPIVDKPIIQHVVEEAIAAGITEIVLVTRFGKEAIENHFDAHYELEHRLNTKGKEVIYNAVVNIIPDNIQIISVRQADASGLGHAILCGKKVIGDNPFAVLLPDVFVIPPLDKTEDNDLLTMANHWNQSGEGQIMVQKVADEDVSNYGIADINCANLNVKESKPINRLVEKPKSNDAPSDLAVVGRYILPGKIFDILQSTGKGADDEVQLTDALDTLLQTDRLNAFLTSAKNYDCGNKLGFLKANLALAMRNDAMRAELKTMFQNG